MMNIRKLADSTGAVLVLMGGIFAMTAWAQTPDSIIRNRGTPYERRPILSASGWCYELGGNSISFYPVVTNAGYSPWMPQGRGFYSLVVGMSNGSVHQEYRPRYFLPTSWRLGSLSRDKLPRGVTLPFRLGSTYYIGSEEISYPNVARQDRVYIPPVELSRYGFRGGQLGSDGNLMNRYMCRSMNLMSN